MKFYLNSFKDKTIVDENKQTLQNRAKNISSSVMFANFASKNFFYKDTIKLSLIMIVIL